MHGLLGDETNGLVISFKKGKAGEGPRASKYTKLNTADYPIGYIARF